MYKVKVGLFFLLFLSMSIFGVFWIKDALSLKRRYHYRVSLRTASWLGNGDPVNINGVKKGKVKFIEIYTDSVVVNFYLEGVRLRDGAFARVENEGFMGGRTLSVYQGHGEFLPEGSLIKGEDTPTLTDMLFTINSILKNLDSITRKTSTTVSNANDFILTTRKDLEVISSDLKELIAYMKILAQNTDNRLAGTYEEILRISNKADRTLSRIDSLISSNGSVQRLLTEDSLYFELRGVLGEVKGLVEDIKKNPSRYLRVNVKLF
jgi:phospholipid/cholesterol/gamma-HCH transport system substrate-binding protein